MRCETWDVRYEMNSEHYFDSWSVFFAKKLAIDSVRTNIHYVNKLNISYLNFIFLQYPPTFYAI